MSRHACQSRGFRCNQAICVAPHPDAAPELQGDDHDRSATPAAEPGDTNAAGFLTVSIRSFACDPSPLQKAVDMTATWTTVDTARHMATAQDDSFDSGDSVPGGSVSREFIAVGPFDNLCRYHPTMPSTVVVAS